jgi:hypothetical protein
VVHATVGIRAGAEGGKGRAGRLDEWPRAFPIIS